MASRAYDQDWALVRVQPLLYRANSFEDPRSNNATVIEGYVKSSELCRGPVMVPSGLSGVRQGYLSAGISSLLIGESCFEARSIALDCILGQLIFKHSVLSFLSNSLQQHWEIPAHGLFEMVNYVVTF